MNWLGYRGSSWGTAARVPTGVGGRPTSMDDLPDKLLVAIAQRLDCVSKTSTMPRVSRRWRAIVGDRALLGPPSCLGAALADDDDARLFAHAESCPRRRLAFADAFRAGASVRALVGLRALGHPFKTADTVTACILAGDIGSLDMLIAWRCFVADRHYEIAARNGRADVLRHLFAKQGVPTTYWPIAAAAARHGHLECLRSAHLSGVKWDAATPRAAVKGGHADCLAYAYTYGCPWEPRDLYYEARSRGHNDCLDYIVAHSSASRPVDVCAFVFRMFAIVIAIALFAGGAFLYA
ncbi:F-box domain containing protein [Pandoravirus salinus]|uniref:F-box domain containing protein n=1 Tax=Pandoravirus salinus TaxID=1349410 RepID=S4VWQ8_9VIRU|nr:F-box domain [Pandoravirus salinus]AGO85089.2 F-box domain containing protein [Pandoravirus salinus]